MTLTPLHVVARAVLNGETLVARQWVMDCAREHVRWNALERPPELAGDTLAVAASLVELMAERAGESPPAWTADAPALREAIYLVPADMRRSREVAEREGPEPLRRRRIFAMPDYLTFA
jgi:hypothetical protein